MWTILLHGPWQTGLWTSLLRTLVSSYLIQNTMRGDWKLWKYVSRSWGTWIWWENKSWRYPLNLMSKSNVLKCWLYNWFALLDGGSTNMEQVDQDQGLYIQQFKSWFWPWVGMRFSFLVGKNRANNSVCSEDCHEEECDNPCELFRWNLLY